MTFLQVIILNQLSGFSHLIIIRLSVFNLDGSEADCMTGAGSVVYKTLKKCLVLISMAIVNDSCYEDEREREI